MWGRNTPQTVGLTSTEMMNICGEKIKSIIIMGENPLLSDPDVNHVKKQLQKLDFLVVIELFISETAQIADVVLPACSFAEKNGTFTATDRRVQLVRKAITPLGNSRPDWMIISEIAKGLGYDMSYSEPSEIMDEITNVAPIYSGITHPRLEEEDLRWPCTSSTIQPRKGTLSINRIQTTSRDTGHKLSLHVNHWKEAFPLAHRDHDPKVRDLD